MARRRHKLFIGFLIVAIIIWIILNSIRIPYTALAEEERNQTFLETRQFENMTPQEDCREEFYAYSYRWVGYDSQSNDALISPVIQITNTDPRAGTYSVEFGFFDEETRPYSQFGNSLKYAEADFFSSRVPISFVAGETKEITIPTSRQRNGVAYWSIADIVAPTVRICRYLAPSGETMTREVEVTRTVSQINQIEKSETLWEWLIGAHRDEKEGRVEFVA